MAKNEEVATLNATVLIATGVWLGAMIFFAAVVAPTVFGTLEPGAESQIIRIRGTDYTWRTRS